MSIGFVGVGFEDDEDDGVAFEDDGDHGVGIVSGLRLILDD